MEYSRFVASDAVETGLEATIEHVRSHLSEIATSDDDPTTFAENVEVRLEQQDDGILVIGHLDAAPQAYYLADDYVPIDDGEYRWEDEGGA